MHSLLLPSNRWLDREFPYPATTTVAPEAAHRACWWRVRTVRPAGRVSRRARPRWHRCFSRRKKGPRFRRVDDARQRILNFDLHSPEHAGAAFEESGRGAGRPVPAVVAKPAGPWELAGRPASRKPGGHTTNARTPPIGARRSPHRMEASPEAYDIPGLQSSDCKCRRCSGWLCLKAARRSRLIRYYATL